MFESDNTGMCPRSNARRPSLKIVRVQLGRPALAPYSMHTDTPLFKIAVPVNAISLFTGAGGLDYGLEAAGITTTVAVESDPDCCATLSKNREWPLIQRDIASISSCELRDAASISPCELDLIAAGPPCQPFSMSANWANGRPKGLGDSRSQTLVEMMRLVEDLHPRLLLVENVPGFVANGGLEYLQKRLAEINSRHDTSYALSTSVLNAADYGVPQLRRRFFAVADREGVPFEFPKRTHGKDRALQWTTAWDAIGGLGDRMPDEDLGVKGRWGDLLASIPEGYNYLWHTDRGGGVPLFGWRTKYWSFLLKLSKKRPAWTVSASPSQNGGPFHWDNRMLSTRELVRLQALPDDVAILGSQASRQKQIGNAVPSLLAELIGREVRRHLSPRVRFRSSPRHQIPHNGAAPPARRRTKVPSKYLPLIGEHAAHPGPGKGPRASQFTTDAED